MMWLNAKPIAYTKPQTHLQDNFDILVQKPGKHPKVANQRVALNCPRPESNVQRRRPAMD